MNRAELKAKAKKAIDGKIFILLAIYLIVAAASSALSFVTMGFGALLVSGSISLSMAAIMLAVVNKNKKPQIEDLKIGFVDGNFVRGLEGFLRLTIFTWLWSLLFVIPGIIKGISYSQMFYILADNKDISAGDAQKKSMEMMEGYKADYFVLGLSFIPWILLTCITFGIAAIYVGPYMNATFALYYEGLKKVAAKKTGKA
jgi:uncharacterized membrane protein